MTLTRSAAFALCTLMGAGLPASVGARQASEKSTPAQSRPATKSASETDAQKLERLRKTLVDLQSRGLNERHPDVIRVKSDIATLERGGVPVPPASQFQGFSVVLLLGDMQPGDSQDTVPVAARKALNDMKDFLPYKSYRLLDTQWVLCCSGSASAFTRLRGLEEQEFELEVRGSPDLQGNIHVRFVLREPGPSIKIDTDRGAAQPKDTKGDGDGEHLSRERELFQLERERVDLTTQLETLRSKVEVGMANPEDVKRMAAQLTMVTRRVNELKQSIQAGTPKVVGRAVIDSSFRMEEGETVVVGSSGVKGGKRALIALLTAAAPARSRKTESK